MERKAKNAVKVWYVPCFTNDGPRNEDGEGLEYGAFVHARTKAEAERKALTEAKAKTSVKKGWEAVKHLISIV